MEEKLRKVNLHIHTVYSDGTYTPLQVVQLAKKLGLAAISITDHDSVEGVQEALKVANKVGIELVPGVEMSSNVGQDEIHILGYYLNWQDKKFLAKLRFFQQIRMERNEELLKRLKEKSSRSFILVVT